MATEVGQHDGPTPQGQSLAEQVRRPAWIPVVARPQSFLVPLAEHVRVQYRRPEVEPVAAAHLGDRRWRAGRPLRLEAPAQVCHVGAQGDLRPFELPVVLVVLVALKNRRSVEELEEPLAVHDATGLDEQDREQRALLRAQRYDPARDLDLELAEHPELHACRVSLLGPGVRGAQKGCRIQPAAAGQLSVVVKRPDSGAPFV